jgi:hypothetical protein
MCFKNEGSPKPNGSASSLIDAGPLPSLAITDRLVGSANAWNTPLSDAE